MPPPLASELRALPLRDVRGDASQTSLSVAEPPGGFSVELFPKDQPSASVLLRHPDTGVQLGFALPGAASARTVDGAAATAQVGGLTVTWTSYLDRLKEELVLSSRPAADQVVFALQSQGLRFTRDRQGGYAALENTGRERFHLQAPTVRDAAGHSGTATLVVEAQAAVIHLDPAFLSTATYPVTIDPTTTYGFGYPNVNTPAQVACTPVENYSSTWCPLQRDGSYAPIGWAQGIYTGAVRTADWSVGTDQYLRLSEVVVGDTVYDNGYGTCNPCYLTVTLSGKNPGDSGYTQIASQTYDSIVDRRWDFTFDPATFRWQTVRVRFDAQLSWQLPGEVQLFGYVEGGAPVVGVPPGTDSNRDDAITTSTDPVNTFNGSFAYTHSDLSLPGRGPAPAVVRSYNSNDTRTTALGPGWTLSYSARLNLPSDGSQDVILVTAEGRSDRYQQGSTDGSGVTHLTPPAGVARQLVGNADGTYTATAPDQTVWTFDRTGKLTALRDRYGNQSTLTYNGQGQLASVSDPAGRGSLTLGHDATSGLLTSVTDWANRVVRYGYDASGRLQTVTDRTNQVTTYAYDGTSSRLTTITDANGHVAVTNHFDAQGRVDWQQDARGLTTGQQTSFSYGTPDTNGNVTTTVTYPVTSFDGFAPQQIDTYNSQC